MKKIELQLTTDQFHQLHKLADGRRASVPVDRELLTKLLVDHSAVLRSLHESGIKLSEPLPARQRTRLK